jgi:protein TonB
MRGDDVAGLADRLHRADSGSALDSPDAKPWHLKLAVQLFDEKGQLTDHGIIEEWWSSPGVDRREYKTDSYTATEIRKDGKLYRTKGAGSAPYYLELLRRQVVHPMPQSHDVEVSKPVLRKVSFGKVPLDCIMLSQPILKNVTLPIGLFPTYCFDPDKEILRASYEFGDQVVVRNALEAFQGKVVANDAVVMSAKTQVATSQIIKLEAITTPETDLKLSDDLIEENFNAVRISSGMISGMSLEKSEPIYPESARKRHVSGLVILHAIIGTDGHIHSLQVVSAPDPDLAIAAIAAVHRWTYRPYQLNGQSVDVETSITINFSLSNNSSDGQGSTLACPTALANAGNCGITNR